MSNALGETKPLPTSLIQGHRDPNAPTQFGQIFAPDEAWLAKLVPEPILEPEIAIIDAHHHLWDLPGYRYLLPELLADVETGHNVVATVFNESHAMYRLAGPEQMKPIGEVEFCAGVAAMSESGMYGDVRACAGIVGCADLMLGDAVSAVLEAQVTAGGGRFKGVRYAAAWDADPGIGNSQVSPGPGLYVSDRFRAGMARLVKLGLSLDAWVFFPQLGDVTELARSFPDANIILCHMGGPLGYGRYFGKRAEVFARWKSSMTELASCANVSVKLGGVTSRLAAFDYNALKRPPSAAELAGYWGPYVRTCIELFGAERCMFESNFPVEKMGVTYAGLWNGFKFMVRDASVGEKRALFNAVAARVYRLEL